jgi:hypothetical protein
VPHCCLVRVVSGADKAIVVDRSRFEKGQKVGSVLGAEVIGWGFGLKRFLLNLKYLFMASQSTAVYKCPMCGLAFT